MSQFIFAAKKSDLVDGGKILVEVDEQLLILFQVDGEYYCLDDVCTHDGGELYEGKLDGFQISCPRHGAKFDIRNGDAVAMPATSATCSHEVKVDGDDILVKLSQN